MMKIVFLNVWHAACKDELTAFIKQEAPTTDIFCFQEAELATRQYLQSMLPEFAEYTATKGIGIGGDIELATYVRSTYAVTRTDALLQNVPDVGQALLTTIKNGDKSITVVNIHGVAFVIDTKLDTPSRLVQSKAIITALKDIDYSAIVGGDFNLSPEAESITMFAAAGYRDLIAAHHIKTTRNRLAWEMYPDNPQYYADYAFTSSAVDVHSFTVPNIEVSDHLPLVIEFDTTR